MFQHTLFHFTDPAPSGEIDLRQAFDVLIYGGNGKIPHGMKIIIRNMRRDSQYRPIVCACNSSMSKEASVSCQYCLGEGYLWDEVWADAYAVYEGSDGGLVRRNMYLTPGQVRVDYRTFYIRYDTPIRYGDKVIEVLLDEEGRVVVPYIRKGIYKPETIQQNRSDHGRIEFISVRCREMDAIRNDYV